MRWKTQTRILLFTSVSIFLLLTSIPPKSGTNERFDPTVTIEPHLDAQGGRPKGDTTIQGFSKSDLGTTHDSANETLKSISTQTVVSRLSQNTGKNIQRLIQILKESAFNQKDDREYIDGKYTQRPNLHLSLLTQFR